MIEDDFDVSRIIGDVLRDSGHEVVSYFKPSADILEHVRTFRPDLVILDARLNSPVTGWGIITSLKQDPDTRAIPIIVCSAAINQIEQNKALLETDQIPVVKKPFELEELIGLVDRMAGSRAS